MSKLKVFIFAVLFLPLNVFSQNEKISDSSKKDKIQRPAYIGFSIGSTFSSFRDFAVSPLKYSGNPLCFSLSRIKLDDERESQYGLSYSSGKYTNNYNNHTSISTTKTASIYYLKLYKLNRLSSDKTNVKIGGLYDLSGNLRNNPSFQNNSVGIDVFSTLFGSVTITRDISRKVAKTKKFLFFKYHLKPVERALAFKLNVGLINSNYRNGYAYTGQSGVLNKPTLMDGYEFNMFSGFRANCELDYTVCLANKNKIQISYIWDANKTGGGPNKFEMAQHTIKLTFLFNTNNK